MLRQQQRFLSRYLNVPYSVNSFLASSVKLYSTVQQNNKNNENTNSSSSEEESPTAPNKKLSLHEKIQQYDMYWYTIGAVRLAWKRVQENKWRWKHIKKELNPIIPYPKDLIPTELTWKEIWNDIIIQSFKDYVQSWKIGKEAVVQRQINDIRRIQKLNPKIKEYRFLPDKYLQDPDDEETEKVETKNGLSVENKQIIQSAAKETGEAVHDLKDGWKELTQNNFLLLRNCLNQFILGYHEGMGRDISQMQNFDISREGISKQFSRDKWMDTVTKAAQTIKEAKEDVTKLAHISNEELERGNLNDNLKSNKDDQK